MITVSRHFPHPLRACLCSLGSIYKAESNTLEVVRGSVFIWARQLRLQTCPIVVTVGLIVIRPCDSVQIVIFQGKTP